jgi:TIR domain
MHDTFEYDVFLSFASVDKETAKPIWQELSLSGLRVFWSDETLKQNIGQSFVSVIQNALTQSRHFVLICTPNSLQSNWVREEYEIFLSESYIPSGRKRRLVIFEGMSFRRSDLPTMLRNIQSTSSVKEIVSILGGVDIQALKKENKELREKIQIAYNEIDKLKNEFTISINENHTLKQTVQAYNTKITELEDTNSILKREHRNQEQKLNIVTAEFRELKEKPAISKNAATDYKKTVETTDVNTTDRNSNAREKHSAEKKQEFKSHETIYAKNTITQTINRNIDSLWWWVLSGLAITEIILQLTYYGNLHLFILIIIPGTTLTLSYFKPIYWLYSIIFVFVFQGSSILSYSLLLGMNYSTFKLFAGVAVANGWLCAMISFYKFRYRTKFNR